MKVFTPDAVAEAASNKYLGVLVAAKYARELNALPLESSPYGANKLTTVAAEALTSGEKKLQYRLVRTRSSFTR
ncbi:DNA-directed RNA polymerase subunit omega [Candidatus Palauibacter sp.]|uniref:DNA-directed RNA polymerase subunit omega n=1 Tax=Candidatus Palauibacter sp. TaxID=3101350 RepID=UPI003AF21F64